MVSSIFICAGYVVYHKNSYCHIKYDIIFLFMVNKKNLKILILYLYNNILYKNKVFSRWYSDRVSYMNVIYMGNANLCK